MQKRIHIFFLLILSITCINAQEGLFYTLKDGLSNSLTNDICQDNKGFIWIATDYGLNRFDGVNFRRYNLTSKQSKVVRTNKFNAISFDKQGRLIVGSENGLYYLNQDSDELEPIEIGVVPELSANQITDILVDHKNNIWVSIAGHGVVCIHQSAGNKYALKTKHFDPKMTDVSCLFESSDNEIWIGTRSYGAYKTNTDFSKIKHYHATAEKGAAIVGNCVYTITEDKNKNIIIGVFGGGITLINSLTGENKSLVLKKEDPRSLICRIHADSNNRIIVGSDAEGLYILDTEQMYLKPLVLNIQSIDIKKSKIHVIYEDQFQNLWIAAHQKGIVIIPKDSQFNQFIGYNPYNNIFPNNSILSISQDRQKDLWVGTDGGGLVKYNLQSKKTEVFAQNTPNTFPDNIILYTYSDADTLWVGTYMSGAIKMNIKTGKQELFTHSSTKNSISSNYINAIAIDHNKRIWFGTGDSGVCCLDVDGTFKTLYEYTNQNYNIEFVYNLYCDKNRRLWILAKNGIFTVDIQNRILDNLPTLNRALFNSAVYSAREDADGIIWLSNINGLIRYNPVTADIKIFHPQNSSIGNNIVNAIEIDDDGNIWGSSSTGIFKYQPKTGFSDYYPAYIGLPNNEFNYGVSLKNEQGDIFFGGLTGISHFSPSVNKTKKEIHQVYITDFTIHDRLETKNNDESDINRIAQKSIVKTDTVSLSYNQSNFSIQFAAIEYAYPERVRYRYILEGKETDWKETNFLNNTVHYTNIDHGEYTFLVRASFDPLFQDYTERKVTIIINPPIWLTWWAKVLYVMLSIGLIYYSYWLVMKRIKTKQELLKEKQAAEILEAQLISFTNISHEIRTPLTLIMGILRKLIKGKEENTERAYRVAMSNSEKILRLTNQLLDVHMLDVGVMKLHFDHIDVIDYVEEIVEAFRPSASEAGVSILFDSEMENLDAIIDPEALSKILYNLLGNAMKFSPKGSQISVMVAWDSEDTFKVIVEDNGIGIPEEDINNIFDRFYKRNEGVNLKQGIGIGLHLVKSLVELMNGNISVRSQIGQGTALTVVLPIIGQKEKDDDLEQNSNVPLDSDKDLIQKTKTNHRVVLVEDNEDILNFLSDELDNYYKTIKFSSAASALEYIQKNQVDLIVSDVMMPEMDGFEFCKIIKSDPKTEIIPVILLTAKADHQSLIRGAKEGADAYITKPFMIEILIANINNLIRVRKAMSRSLNVFDVGEIDKINEYKGPDEKLMERFINIVKAQIDDPDLSIEYLSTELGISRANLYRKIKSKTNQTPSVFIRNIRLEQAALLLKKKVPASEVAYFVGFNSHSYFSKLFNEYYGCSPSEYIAKNN